MQRWFPWVNLATVFVALVVNGLANALPLNGQSTGAISDKFKVFFVPAGYAIWGVIYIAWIAFTVYQLLPAQRDNARLGAPRLAVCVQQPSERRMVVHVAL